MLIIDYLLMLKHVGRRCLMREIDSVQLLQLMRMTLELVASSALEPLPTT